MRTDLIPESLDGQRDRETDGGQWANMKWHELGNQKELGWGGDGPRQK